jgi:hypothetical protein
MSTRIPKTIRLTVVRALGQALGIACFAVGSIFGSRSLRALGLPSVAEHNFRRGNLDAASARAIQLLRLAEAESTDWNYGNAVHKAHLMLGRVALARGDIVTAEAELIASARIPGSPQLASFGPNMQLALELLQAGRKDAVLEYFCLCGNFWEMGQSQLRTWSIDIENGRACFRWQLALLAKPPYAA